MGGNFAPPYAILSISYLEEKSLYINLPLTFPPNYANFIIDQFKHFMDDGFIP